MIDPEKLNRLSRLTAILLKLQSRSSLRAQDLADHFGVSKRTIYRDLKSLEEAGVPISTDENGNYGLVEGFVLPPVMFTEEEANALIIAEKLIHRTKDQSLIQAFNRATDKIKTVLPATEKEKADFLGSRTIIGRNWRNTRNSDLLTQIQQALTARKVVTLDYLKKDQENPSRRQVEPFAIYQNPEDNWVLIAFCRLREDFRSFRLDRIQKLKVEDEIFEPHSMTLEQYVEIQRQKHFSRKL